MRWQFCIHWVQIDPGGLRWEILTQMHLPVRTNHQRARNSRKLSVDREILVDRFVRFLSLYQQPV